MSLLEHGVQSSGIKMSGAYVEFKVEGEFITLQSLLKAAGLTGSGGEAKIAITSGEVKVDGEVEIRRSKKIRAGQVVAFAGEEIKVIA
ncbi:MAG: RNA-binding S4 domain-containing protein [Bdellovibrionota bacterium]